MDTLMNLDKIREDIHVGMVAFIANVSKHLDLHPWVAATAFHQELHSVISQIGGGGRVATAVDTAVPQAYRDGWAALVAQHAEALTALTALDNFSDVREGPGSEQPAKQAQDLAHLREGECGILVGEASDKAT